MSVPRGKSSDYWKKLEALPVCNIPANIYLFKVTIETENISHWRRSGVFIVNFTYFTSFSSVSIVEFEQENISWDVIIKAGLDNSRTSRTYVYLLLFAYAWFWIWVRWHVRSLFHWFCKLFKNFLVLIIPYCLKTYCYIYLTFNLCLFSEETLITVCIYIKETLFLNFSYKLIKKYFSLPYRALVTNLGCH